MFIRHFISLVFILLVSCLASQGDSIPQSNLSLAEDSLSKILNSMIITKDISQKVELNKSFLDNFQQVLSLTESFEYPFDSLKNIGKLRSPDGCVRVITWNLPVSAGQQHYFGFIQVKDVEEIKLYQLVDNRSNIENPQMEIVTSSKWYGALYYHIGENIYNNKTYYTLLGVDFNNMFSTRRIIEVLTFNEEKEPIFGSPLFRINNQTINRIIFEYSARVNMMLSYTDDHQMIVFDHLSPSRADMAGNYQFYGPDFSYDGFKFTDGFWNYYPDIDLRNPLKTSTPKPVTPPVENREPGFLYRSNLELRGTEQQ